MNVREQYQKKLTSPKEAVKRIVDGDIIDVHGSAQTSVVLLSELYPKRRIKQCYRQQLAVFLRSRPVSFGLQ